MRLLLVGAFPYPHDQGSQVYFQEQAIALRAAGADVTLMTYGAAGRFDPEKAGRDLAEHWRALDGFDHHRVSERTATRSLRSGLNRAKPGADLRLAMTLRHAVASRMNSDDAYDAIVTHNAEATLVAVSTLPKHRPPILYCVHTLLGRELSAYLKGPKRKGFSKYMLSGRRARTITLQLDRFGNALDGWLAERVDGWIALTRSAERVMMRSGKTIGSVVPPPIPDPERGEEPLCPEQTARRHGLVPGRFFLYSGNLDAYQELDILGAAAARLVRRAGEPPVLVIATHRRGGRPDRNVSTMVAASMPGVQVRQVASAREMQALMAAARASLVMRRAEGGFPIKLANSLALSTPPIAFHAREWGLHHETDSLICSADRPAEALADAIERLSGDDLLARKLGAGARALYLERHLPERAAAATLDTIVRILGARPR